MTYEQRLRLAVEQYAIWRYVPEAEHFALAKAWHQEHRDDSGEIVAHEPDLFALELYMEQDDDASTGIEFKRMYMATARVGRDFERARARYEDELEEARDAARELGYVG